MGRGWWAATAPCCVVLRSWGTAGVLWECDSGDGELIRSGVCSPRCAMCDEESFAAAGDIREVVGGDRREGREPVDPVGLGWDMFGGGLPERI